MSIYKDDMNDAKQRLSAFWDHELVDRPCISYRYPKPDVKFPKDCNIIDYFMPWYMAEHWDDIETFTNNFEGISKALYFGAEAIPRLWPNYGPGIVAAVFGVEPQYNAKVQTVWFHRDTPIDEIAPLLESAKLNRNNKWYDRLLRVTEYAAKQAGKQYAAALTDLGGVLDILQSFLGPTNLILNLKRRPEVIDRCRAIILEKLLKIYDDLQNIIERYSEGCSAWIDMWCPKRWYPVQCDFSAFLNPNWFRKFALPDIKAQIEHMDYSVYHLDGPNALPHLDDLLSIYALTGIQWVPGAGRALACSDEWMPVYKKIHAAGKSTIIYVFENPEPLAHFYEVLDNKLLFPIIIFMDFYKAKFYLPKPFGGQGGEGDFRMFKKQIKDHLKG